MSGPICWLESPRPVFALVCYWSAGSYFHFLWSLPVKHNSMERRSMWLSGAIQELGKSRLIHVPFREEASWEQPQHKSPTWRCIPQTCNTDPSLQHFQETGNHRSHSPKRVIKKSLFPASKEISTAWLCQPALAFHLIRDREVLCSQGCHNCLLSLFSIPVPSLKGGCNETDLTDAERPFKAEQITKPFIFNLQNFWR